MEKMRESIEIRGIVDGIGSIMVRRDKAGSLSVLFGVDEVRKI